MKIDITSPEGNTMASLGIARRFLREANRNDAIDAMTTAVMNAESPEEARAAITRATYGSIEFYDPQED